MLRPPIDSWRRDLRPRVFAVVFSVVLFVLITMMLGVLTWPPFARFDASVSAAVRSLQVRPLTTIATCVTRIGDLDAMLILVPLSALVLWWLGRHSGAIVVLVTVAGGRLLGTAVQVLVQRPRPVGVALIDMPSGYSFPSGHALAACLFFGALSFIVLGEVRRPALRYSLVTLFGLLAVAIGLSRVYLGVHYLGDVIAAWLLGGAIVVVAILGYFALSQPSSE